MNRPVFDRVDFAIVLPDGTMGDRVVFYHDNLLNAVVEEVAADADKVGGSFVFLTPENKLPRWYFDGQTWKSELLDG